MTGVKVKWGRRPIGPLGRGATGRPGNSGQFLQEAGMQGGSSLKVEAVDSVYRSL